MQQQPGAWSPAPQAYGNAPVPPQGGYGAPAPAQPSPLQPSLPSADAAGQMAQQAAVGFLSAMIDFSFTSYVAPKLAKALYVLVILGAIGVTLAGVGNGISQLFSSYGRIENAVMSVVLAPLTGVGVLILGRLYLEIMCVLFRIAEQLAEINRKTR